MNNPATKKTVSVVAAIVVHDQKVLCTQRGSNSKLYISNMWEFPGGKIELGETDSEAIRREIDEELSISIAVEREFLTVRHEYPDFIIVMKTFICRWLQGEIKLSEHIAYKFVEVQKLAELDWAAADIPIVNKLMEEGL